MYVSYRINSSIRYFVSYIHSNYGVMSVGDRKQVTLYSNRCKANREVAGITSKPASGTKVLWNMRRLRTCLSLREGILRRKFEDVDGKSGRWHIVLPKVYRTEFMTIAHWGMSGGHPGTSKTAAGIRSRAYWPTWKNRRSCEPVSHAPGITE